MTAPGTREELLRLLRREDGDYLSGEALSRALEVSRSAVWKQIRLLREHGYVIEAIPSRGYRLAETPDSLIPAEIQADLGTHLIGRELVCLQETDSTNARAHELGEAGAVEGMVVIADQQSAGKGRLGRRWTSPGGVNLYASVLLRPQLPPRCAPQLTFVSAVAVARAVAAISGLPAVVKWPNDVLLGGRKVAGLLNEMSAETERIHYVILGIGVNLNMSPEQFPDDLRYPATSVATETGAAVSRLAFTRILLRQLDELYQLYLDQGIEPILKLWQALFPLQGGRVSVDLQGTLLCGRVEGLDGDGALLLRLDDGRLERILAGDVRPVAEA